jgi:hypothetical protein
MPRLYREFRSMSLSSRNLVELVLVLVRQFDEEARDFLASLLFE